MAIGDLGSEYRFLKKEKYKGFDIFINKYIDGNRYQIMIEKDGRRWFTQITGGNKDEVLNIIKRDIDREE